MPRRVSASSDAAPPTPPKPAMAMRYAGERALLLGGHPKRCLRAKAFSLGEIVSKRGPGSSCR
jgi:hypothetical protein